MYKHNLGLHGKTAIYGGASGNGAKFWPVEFDSTWYIAKSK
jgi:hypothetical protein